MGVSYSHRVTIRFANEDDSNLFHNYLQRLVTKHHINRTSGYDIENYPQGDTNWWMREIYDLGFDVDSYLDFDIDCNQVVLDTCGYGNVPEFVIAYALEQYNAVEFYSEFRGCQGQERSKINSYYNKAQDRFEYMFIPDWVSDY